MVGPIAHIGTPGTSQYRVDWGPRQRDQEQMWRGLGQLVKSVGEQQRATKEKKSLAELAAFVGDGKQLISEAARRGVPLAKVREMVNLHSLLQPKKGDPFTLGKDDVRFDATGGVLARGPAGAPKDARTTEQRNISGFLQRNPGATESDYFKMRRPAGMRIDARNMGNIPTDHRVVYDDQSRPSRYEVIPGSPTARKIAAGQAKAAGRQGDRAAQASLVDTHIGRIRQKVEKGSGPFGMIPVTGLAGSALEDVPGSAAHDVSKLVDSLKANVGFDALNRMRANSPTGGALGQVSERELGFLQSTIASLEQSQSEGQFLENLSLVKNAFNRVIHGTEPGGAPPARFTGGSPGLPSPTVNAGGFTAPTIPSGGGRRTMMHGDYGSAPAQAGVTGLRAPGVPQGNMNPAAVFDGMSEAQLDGLNLSNMNMDALDALEAAYRRKKGASLAGDYMASGRR